MGFLGTIQVMSDKWKQSPEADGLKRLSYAVVAARGRKFKTVDRARIAAGVARGTWEAVENGRRVRPFSLAAIEEALDWEPGHAQQIINGEVGGPVINIEGDFREFIKDKFPEVLNSFDRFTASVGPSPQDDSYVASPGAKVESEVSDAEVLREIRAMRNEVRELSVRMAFLEQRGPQSLGGSSGEARPDPDA